MKVYRFLSEEFALAAIKERRLKISRFDALNDPFEWAPPITSESRQRRAFEAMKQEMALDRGLLCFSRDWHNPLLWSHYADKHAGIALGFDLPDHLSISVDYRKSRISCDWEQFSVDRDYALEIIRKVVCSKSEHWAYEEEVRIHIELDHSTSEEGRYFLNFEDGLVLKEVIVGPLCTVTNHDLKSLMSKAGIKATTKKARLAFKSYDVVEQRNGHLWK